MNPRGCGSGYEIKYWQLELKHFFPPCFNLALHTFFGGLTFFGSCWFHDSISAPQKSAAAVSYFYCCAPRSKDYPLTLFSIVSLASTEINFYFPNRRASITTSTMWIRKEQHWKKKLLSLCNLIPTQSERELIGNSRFSLWDNVDEELTWKARNMMLYALLPTHTHLM